MKKLLIYIAPLFLMAILGYRYFNVVPGIINLNKNRITVLGHRGMSSTYTFPGNSVPSVLEALRLGAHGCELDVQMTKNGVLVAYHNKILDGHTSSVGKISENTLASIESTIYSGDFPKKTSIVSLDSLFSAISEPKNYFFSFDCKLYGLNNQDPEVFYDRFTAALEELIQNHDLKGRVLIESDDMDFHRKLIEKKVEVFQFITGHGATKGSQIAAELGLYGVGLGSSASKKDIEKVHEKGLRVMTWTPRNAFENIRAVRKNPDIIQTADLDHLLKYLGKQ